MKITPSKSGFATIFFYLIFYPLRLENLIMFQSLRMAFWATAISIRAGHYHPAKKKKSGGGGTKGETIFDIPGMAPKAIGGRVYVQYVRMLG